MNYTKTELHTHLVGMLSIKGILRMTRLLNYPGFPIDANGELDFENVETATRSKNITPQIIKGLMIPKGETIEYNELDNIYYNRNSLLAELGKMMSNVVDNSLNKVYALYLNFCLDELISQGVEYVEISFSNLTRIKFMMENIHPKILEKIDIRFLLSTNRSRSIVDMKSDKKKLEKGIKNDAAIGFDFMGLEEEFNNNENDSRKAPSNSINSFKIKLDMTIDILKDYPRSVLRIHAGENIRAKKNPLSTLKMIDSIAKERGIVIPPPEVRLGHAIYYQDCDEYLDLLRKYKVIIEINSSSNMALSNVKTCKDINYEYYVNNGIPLVLSTDGGGMYDTSIEKENHIALNIAGGEIFKRIFETDSQLLSDKRR